MNYLDSAEDVLITKERAIKELLRHSCTEIDLFLKEMGNHDCYLAHEVLGWLGY